MAIQINRPKLAPYQENFLDDRSAIVVVEAATKVGKTASMLVWLLEEALAQPDRIVWWVAPVYSQAKIAYDRCIKQIIRLEKVLDKEGLELKFERTKSPMKIICPNGSKMEFLSADNYNALYGQDVNACVIDEATRCKEDAWHAVRSTLTATRGKVKIVGNVRGRKNWVHKLSKNKDVAYYKVTAWDAVEAGILAREEIEQAEQDLPESVFKELYLAEPASDGGNPFDVKAIQACVRDYQLDRGKVKYIGVDLAKSYDWTVIVGVDENGTVQLFERWQGDWAGTIQKLQNLIGSTPAYIDSTGVGDPIFEALQPVCANLAGYKYSATTKQQLMLLLASYFQREELIVPSKTELLEELLAFEYSTTSTGRVQYSAPTGLHDDCVNALALAISAKEHLKPKQSAIIRGI